MNNTAISIDPEGRIMLISSILENGDQDSIGLVQRLEISTGIVTNLTVFRFSKNGRKIYFTDRDGCLDVPSECIDIPPALAHVAKEMLLDELRSAGIFR